MLDQMKEDLRKELNEKVDSVSQNLSSFSEKITDLTDECDLGVDRSIKRIRNLEDGLD